MRVRLFVEIQIDSAALLQTFGDKLAEITASGAIEAKVGEVIGTSLQGLPNLQDVQISVIPVALKSDRLS